MEMKAFLHTALVVAGLGLAAAAGALASPDATAAPAPSVDPDAAAFTIMGHGFRIPRVYLTQAEDLPGRTIDSWGDAVFMEAAFAGPGRTRTRPVGALKRTLNDLGRMHFGGDAWKPLDAGEGRIGPETATASRLREARYGGRRGVAKVLRAAGPRPLTERFGRFLGIL